MSLSSQLTRSLNQATQVGDIPVTMLRLMFRLTMVVPRNLGTAKDDIYDFLLTHNIHDVHVKIVHYELCFQPSLFAIDPSHQAVEIYERAKSKLVEQLDANLSASWRVLCLFNVGRTEENAVPTVVVMVDPGTVVDFANIPEMGFSIGVKGERGGGTLGGFVTLSQNGITRKGILTNYHVVRPPSSADANLLLQADRLGSSILRPDETQVDVLYLADKDVKATLQDANNSIRSVEEDLERIRAEQEERRVAGARPSVRLKNTIESFENQIVEWKEKRQILQSMPVNLGKVLVSSGKSLVTNRIIDWAFIEATSDKVGRATDLTAGICNGTLAFCNWGKSDRTEEYVIVDKSTEQPGHTQSSFCAAGDSGSFIIDRHGKICGLLYGEMSGLCGPPGDQTMYIRPVRSGNVMRDIIHSIESRTTPRDSDGKPTGEPAILGLPE
ncbi:hypothetical protein T310_5081 [Rasamsonia emersonii CBS 393.64]|uniref:Peptidase S1 domain-containing protein n=1 Tax=Rasamsonia emersonii (strain ATCC 16479 / CBS 393.64 / IMI 116815) TaxID=1408163 RepID=A0A0F4YRH6_RASE3|nr:hypothetical protein T310_5081 [Rasamsonia emersonii CBS 393.64]KKA20892.1 hypothetical protein T310_5081 [Rasamsonia emersonii CBS 393.64]